MRRAITTATLITAAQLSIAAAHAQDAARVLFVRGADRSGGFLEAGNDEDRTEQLADINNTSQAPRNHGWFELAQMLRGAGFTVEQIAEPLEADAPPQGQTRGAPVRFDQMDLTPYRVIVLGSNNAVYEPAQIDAIEAFVKGGGGVLFISDANFGSDWPDAPNSDQQFLDRFGWVMQQDRGTYVLRRSDADFLVPDAPPLAGVDAFDGEGVSPIVVPESDLPGVRTSLVVRAKPGQQTRNNDSESGQGTSRPVGPRDASLCIAFVGCGRIAGHLDRNTFFNLNGAGTNINRFDNKAYAINLFRFLAFGPGDRDNDGDVDIDDLYRQHTEPADVDGDGQADAADLACVTILARRGERADRIAGRR